MFGMLSEPDADPAGSVRMAMEGRRLVLAPTEPVDDIAMRLMEDLATCAAESSIPVVIDLRCLRYPRRYRRRIEWLVDVLQVTIQDGTGH